jgi:hypothetical protein
MDLYLTKYNKAVDIIKKMEEKKDIQRQLDKRVVFFNMVKYYLPFKYNNVEICKDIPLIIYLENNLEFEVMINNLIFTVGNNWLLGNLGIMNKDKYVYWISKRIIESLKRSEKRYLVFNLSLNNIKVIENDEISNYHINLVVIDTKLKKYYLLDPVGINPDIKDIKEILKNNIEQIFGGYEYIDSKSITPIMNVKTIAEKDNEEKDNGIVWVYYLLDKIISMDIKENKINEIKKIQEDLIKEKSEDLTRTIMEYFLEVFEYFHSEFSLPKHLLSNNFIFQDRNSI